MSYFTSLSSSLIWQALLATLTNVHGGYICELSVPILRNWNFEQSINSVANTYLNVRVADLVCPAQLSSRIRTVI